MSAQCTDARVNTVTPALFARYFPGDAYGPHVDAVMGGNPPIRQDISMTVFLAPPETYQGGELCLHHHASERQSVKLPAGHAFSHGGEVASRTCLHNLKSLLETL